MPNQKVKRIIAAFEKAVFERAYLPHKIPIAWTDEQLAIEHNYIKARAKLERLLEELQK